MRPLPGLLQSVQAPDRCCCNELDEGTDGLTAKKILQKYAQSGQRPTSPLPPPSPLLPSPDNGFRGPLICISDTCISRDLGHLAS
jgi:hypothetical protein